MTATGLPPTEFSVVCTCTADNPAGVEVPVIYPKGNFNSSAGELSLMDEFQTDLHCAEWVLLRWPRIPCSCLMSRNLASLVLCNIGCIGVFGYFSYSVYILTILHHVFHWFHQFHPMLPYPYGSLSMNYHPLEFMPYQKEPTVNGRSQLYINGRCLHLFYSDWWNGTLHSPDQERERDRALSASKILISPSLLSDRSLCARVVRGLASAISWVPWTSLRDVH